MDPVVSCGYLAACATWLAARTPEGEVRVYSRGETCFLVEDVLAQLHFGFAPPPPSASRC